MRSKALSETLLLLILSLMLPACAPADMPKAEVEIVGQFRSDGSCEVSAAGHSLFDSTDSARTFYKAPPEGTLIPSGFIVHEVSCRRFADSTDRRGLLLLFPVHRLGQAPPGVYTIAPLADVDGKAMTIDAVYADPRSHGLGTPRAGFDGDTGDVYLTAKTGVVRFERIDTVRVVGTFRLKAVREHSM